MSKKLTTEEFVNRSIAIHGGLYDYSLVKYTGNKTHVSLFCNKHNHVFSQNAGTHMGGQSGCTQCFVEGRLETRAKIAAENSIEGYKVCGNCEKLLETANFYGNKMGAGGLRSCCMDCDSKRGKAAKEALWKSPSKIRRAKAHAAEYTRNNKEAANLKSAKRRANRLSRTPHWVDKEYEALFISEIYSLASLRETCTGVEWQVDHIVPFLSDQVCGLHCSDNMQLITAFENLSKSNRHWPDMP